MFWDHKSYLRRILIEIKYKLDHCAGELSYLLAPYRIFFYEIDPNPTAAPADAPASRID